MTFPFLLSLFLWTPCATGLFLLVLPARTGRSRNRAAALLGAAAPLGLLAVGPGTVTRSWIPPIGATYDLTLDGLSMGLVAVTVVVAIAAVASCAPGDRRGLASTLVAETAIAGAACAGDALLLLGFTGAAVAAIAVLTGSRRFAVSQWLGLGLVLTVYAFCYHESWSQTGFPTSSLVRLQSLVTFPELERWAILAGAAGPLIMMLGVRSGEGAGRIVVAAYTLLPGLLLFRLVSSVFPDGASERATLMIALGIAFVLAASLAPRARLPLALQGVFVVGLFSLDRDGLIAAEIEWGHMALVAALWELALERPRSRIALLARVLVLVPPSGWLLVRSLPPGSVVALAAAWIVLNLRLWREARRAPADEKPSPPRVSPLAVVPLAVLSLALYVTPFLYRAQLEPSLDPILPPAAVPDDVSE